MGLYRNVWGTNTKTISLVAQAIPPKMRLKGLDVNVASLQIRAEINVVLMQKSHRSNKVKQIPLYVVLWKGTPDKICFSSDFIWRIV